MINDEDIVFITTTLSTPILIYQQRIIRDKFPNSEVIIVDGSTKWPIVWFDWIKHIEKKCQKWVIHIDEDFFIESKEEIIKSIQFMEDNNIDIIGIPDGYHEYRGANPVAINSFFMIINIDRLKFIIPELELNTLEFGYSHEGWVNNKNIKYNDIYLDLNFDYSSVITNTQYNFYFEQEPYYYLFWVMKKNLFKFHYFYPYFDDYLKSTNPRLTNTSSNIGIHMWYLREYNSSMDVHGIPNNIRYKRIKDKLDNV